MIVNAEIFFLFMVYLTFVLGILILAGFMAWLVWPDANHELTLRESYLHSLAVRIAALMVGVLLGLAIPYGVVYGH